MMLLVVALAACSTPMPFKVADSGGDITCGVVSSLKTESCFSLTPEVSETPSYRMHVVEFDDQGWLYPGRDDRGYVPGMRSAHGQLDRAVEDITSQLKKNKRVLLLIYVHGWKHSAAHDDRDVKRFRQMLKDAAVLDSKHPERTVIGIYVGWRGAGGLSPSNPLINLTFWTRKNAALHVAEGAPRELFARIRALRERWNGMDEVNKSRPILRTVVIGHSFGGWIAFSALSPSLMELFAHPVDDDSCSDSTKTQDNIRVKALADWRRARLRGAADMVILVNPAFEATRYRPIHDLARRAGRALAKCGPAKYESPTLVLVTSTADAATGTAFPIGRFFNTLFQHPFVSDHEEFAAKHTPGFVNEYVTHQLGERPADPKHPVCGVWTRATSEEKEADRIDRMTRNAKAENEHHSRWAEYLRRINQSLPNEWNWQYCGGAAISRQAHSEQPVNSPVWNVVTDDSVIRDHNDIMGESLHAFFRQIYLDLPD